MRLTEVTKSYVTRAGVVPALRDVTLTIDPARMTAVMGPSGSGKSTLLQCAAGLDRPSGGSIMLAGQDLATLDEEELAVVRAAAERTWLVLAFPTRTARRYPDVMEVLAREFTLANEDGQTEPVAYPPDTDTSQPFTGDLARKERYGWGTDGILVVQHADPLPFTLQGITGSMQLENP